MNETNLDEISIKKKIKKEVTRFKKFQQSLLGTKEKIIVDNIDMRNYAKYVLKEAAGFEKRELLDCLTSRITLQNKKIKLI